MIGPSFLRRKFCIPNKLDKYDFELFKVRMSHRIFDSFESISDLGASTTSIDSEDLAPSPSPKKSRPSQLKPSFKLQGGKLQPAKVPNSPPAKSASKQLKSESYTTFSRGSQNTAQPKWPSSTFEDSMEEVHDAVGSFENSSSFDIAESFEDASNLHRFAQTAKSQYLFDPKQAAAQPSHGFMPSSLFDKAPPGRGHSLNAAGLFARPKRSSPPSNFSPMSSFERDLAAELDSSLGSPSPVVEKSRHVDANPGPRSGAQGLKTATATTGRSERVFDVADLLRMDPPASRDLITPAHHGAFDLIGATKMSTGIRHETILSAADLLNDTAAAGGRPEKIIATADRLSSVSSRGDVERREKVAGAQPGAGVSRPEKILNAADLLMPESSAHAGRQERILSAADLLMPPSDLNAAKTSNAGALAPERGRILNEPDLLKASLPSAISKERQASQRNGTSQDQAGYVPSAGAGARRQIPIDDKKAYAFKSKANEPFGLFGLPSARGEVILSAADLVAELSPRNEVAPRAGAQIGGRGNVLSVEDVLKSSRSDSGQRILNASDLVSKRPPPLTVLDESVGEEVEEIQSEMGASSAHDYSSAFEDFEQSPNISRKVDPLGVKADDAKKKKVSFDASLSSSIAESINESVATSPFQPKGAEDDQEGLEGYGGDSFVSYSSAKSPLMPSHRNPLHITPTPTAVQNSRLRRDVSPRGGQPPPSPAAADHPREMQRLEGWLHPEPDEGRTSPQRPRAAWVERVVVREAEVQTDAVQAPGTVPWRERADEIRAAVPAYDLVSAAIFGRERMQGLACFCLLN